jgi:hypothetical protein
MYLSALGTESGREAGNVVVQSATKFERASCYGLGFRIVEMRNDSVTSRNDLQIIKQR